MCLQDNRDEFNYFSQKRTWENTWAIFGCNLLTKLFYLKLFRSSWKQVMPQLSVNHPWLTLLFAPRSKCWTVNRTQICRVSFVFGLRCILELFEVKNTHLFGRSVLNLLCWYLIDVYKARILLEWPPGWVFLCWRGSMSRLAFTTRNISGRLPPWKYSRTELAHHFQTDRQA